MTRKDLVFTRSRKGIKDKYDEAMKLLEYSIILVKLFEIKEFNNVIAAQLRLLLCDITKDGDNSLIRKIQPDPKLFPINELSILNEKGHAFIEAEMFNYNKPMIPLTDWLNQVILTMNLQGKKQNITILNFIKFSANKGGGAHVDSDLVEKSFIVDIHSDEYLCDIALGLFRSVGRDFNLNSEKHVAYLISKFKGKASE